MAAPEWIELQVLEALKNNEAIQTVAEDRIYPVKAPQAVLLPFVVYQRDSSQPNYFLTGYTSEGVIVTVSAFGKIYKETKALALGVREAMNSIKAILRYDRDVYYNDADAYGIIMEFYCLQAGGYCNESM